MADDRGDAGNEVKSQAYRGDRRGVEPGRGIRREGWDQIPDRPRTARASRRPCRDAIVRLDPFAERTPDADGAPLPDVSRKRRCAGVRRRGARVAPGWTGKERLPETVARLDFMRIMIESTVGGLCGRGRHACPGIPHPPDHATRAAERRGPETGYRQGRAVLVRGRREGTCRGRPDFVDPIPGGRTRSSPRWNSNSPPDCDPAGAPPGVPGPAFARAAGEGKHHAASHAPSPARQAVRRPVRAYRHANVTDDPRGPDARSREREAEA